MSTVVYLESPTPEALPAGWDFKVCSWESLSTTQQQYLKQQFEHPQTPCIAGCKDKAVLQAWNNSSSCKALYDAHGVPVAYHSEKSDGAGAQGSALAEGMRLMDRFARILVRSGGNRG
jgi:hypothetical protein